MGLMRMKLKLVICILAFILVSASVAYAFQWKTYDTKGHYKAKNTWISVRYPGHWTAAEGNRPNIIQKFTYYDQNTQIQYMLMLQIIDLPKGVTQESNVWPEDEWILLGQDLALEQNLRVRNIEKIRHEGQNGIIIKCYGIDERVGLKLYFELDYMYLMYNDKFIILGCYTGGALDAQQSITNSHFSDSIRGIYMQYFNSLIIMEKY